MATNENLNGLKVHKFKTYKQYARAKAQGVIGENDLYIIEKPETITVEAANTAASVSKADNAKTADAFSSSKTVSLTGDVTGSASSTGGWAINAKLPNTGVVAQTYGPGSGGTLAHSGSFTVPNFTVDAKGRITHASVVSYKLPAASGGGGGTTETMNKPTISVVDANDTKELRITAGSGTTPSAYAIYINSSYLVQINYKGATTSYDIWPTLREKGGGNYTIGVEAISATGISSSMATTTASVQVTTCTQYTDVNYDDSPNAVGYFNLSKTPENPSTFLKHSISDDTWPSADPVFDIDTLNNVRIYTTSDNYWEGSIEVTVTYDYLDGYTPKIMEETLIFSCYYCLAEGTLILMADGSSKAIEDVRRGDKIMSWDLDTGAQIEVNCITAVCSGVDNVYKTMSFNNNSYIHIAKSHQVYNKSNNRLMPNRQWKAEDCGIASDGSTIRMTDQCTTIFEKQMRHYVIVSENCLYFANGILTGHSIQTLAKAERALKELYGYSNEEIAAIKAEADLTEKEEKWNKDPKFKEMCATRSTTPDKLKKEIASLKDEIATRDYKTIKRMQGLIGDEEWQENLTKCGAIRTRINASEEELAAEIQFRREARVACGYPATARPEHIRYKENYKVIMNALKSRNARLNNK